MAYMRMQEEYVNNAITSTNNVRHTIAELKANLVHFNVPNEDVFINLDAAEYLVKELFSVLLGKYRNAGVIYHARSYELENSID